MKLDLIFTKRFSYRRRCALSSIGGAIVIHRKPTACAWAQLFFMKGNKKRTLAYSAPNSLTPCPIFSRFPVCSISYLMKQQTKEPSIRFRQSFFSSAARGSYSHLSFLERSLGRACALFYLTPSMRQAAGRYSSLNCKLVFQQYGLWASWIYQMTQSSHSNQQQSPKKTILDLNILTPLLCSILRPI